MAILRSDTAEGKAARAAMGKASGTDLAGYDMQLASTKMFFTAKDAAAFGRSADLVTTMDSVRGFLFDHGLLGDGAPSADVVGIEFVDGSILGDKGNVKFRFDNTYMEMAAEGAL